jgi:hypothetical protein
MGTATSARGRPGTTIALRADMDVLPVQEETGLEFASVNPGNLLQGASTLLLAIGVGLGIAAGASPGTDLGRPMADQLHGIRVRARARRHEIFNR